jgi:hypothetical protein
MERHRSPPMALHNSLRCSIEAALVSSVCRPFDGACRVRNMAASTPQGFILLSHVLMVLLRNAGRWLLETNVLQLTRSVFGRFAKFNHVDIKRIFLICSPLRRALLPTPVGTVSRASTAQKVYVQFDILLFAVCVLSASRLHCWPTHVCASIWGCPARRNASSSADVRCDAVATSTWVLEWPGASPIELWGGLHSRA